MKKQFVIISIVFVLFTRTSFSEEGSCAEMYKHLENYERTASMLMMSKFNRDGTVTPTEKDGRLWEMWQKLQRFKKEKDDDIEKYCRPRSVLP